MVNSTLLSFVTESTAPFDESHDVHHAIAVLKNAMLIAEADFPWCDKDILEFSAMLHDVCDHKYPNSITKDERNNFIYKELPLEKAIVVIDIIDNISYSQEVKGLRKTLHAPFNIYQDIISDADKLEALGEVGLKRCITFTTSRGGRVPEEVVQHCQDKLLHLKDEFIRTLTGKRLAEPLHDYIVKYCQEDTHLVI